MDEDEREALLKRVNRQSATVGASVPETLDIHGDEIDLREFLVESRKVDRIPPDTMEVVGEALRTLRAERETRVERIETGSIDRERAEALANEITGIDRAINALENIRQPEFADTANATSIDDHKRWLGFLDTIK
ncbi:hypothetical protein JCM18237_15910 [Halorubrum luteum]